MAAIPYMQWFPADYLSDTAHLSTLEHGAYMLLLWNYWQRGKPLPDNPARLAKIAGLSDAEWGESGEVLAEFFEVEGGYWNHSRIDADLERIKSRSELARRAGEKSWKARKAMNKRLPNKRSTDVERTLNECPTIEIDIERENEIESKSITNTVCAELREDANSPPPVLTFPTNGEPKSWALSQEQVVRWRELYPGVDVLGECRKALAWIEATPTRRKTARGMNRFLTSWLGRSNDRGVRGGQSAEPPPRTERERAAPIERKMRNQALAAYESGELDRETLDALDAAATKAMESAHPLNAIREVRAEYGI